MTKLLMRRLELIPGRAYLLTAVVIFAAANAVTRKLTDIGAQNLVDGRNPISLCNVLFVGNLVALMALVGGLLARAKPPALDRNHRQKLANAGGHRNFVGGPGPGVVFYRPGYYQR
jgi:hypothetical protein